MINNPSYLWIGPTQELKKVAQNFIKSILCKKSSKKSGCHNCNDCKLIDQKQHYLVRWLEPENYYTMAQLEVIFKTIAFSLEPDQSFFFVIERADLLTHICANSLLKSLEEPPAGYHFLLLAQRQEGILPTIMSRCVINYLDVQATTEKHPLFNYFTGPSNTQLAEFNKELERAKIMEREVIDLLDQLYNHWSDKLKKELANQNITNVEHAKKIINLLEATQKYLPMPGSSKIFLRNLFLNYILT